MMDIYGYIHRASLSVIGYLARSSRGRRQNAVNRGYRIEVIELYLMRDAGSYAFS